MVVGGVDSLFPLVDTMLSMSVNLLTWMTWQQAPSDWDKIELNPKLYLHHPLKTKDVRVSIPLY